MENPGYENNNGDVPEMKDFKQTKKDEEDLWELPELKTDEKSWKEQNTKERVIRVLLAFLRGVLLLLLLYIFICSLDLMSSAFRLLGGKTAGEVMSNSFLLKNPIAGVVIGILTTVLVQSSSTSTSIVITMTGAGLIHPPLAVPIIMGANIGTSVTNTIVSLGQAGDKDEFRRAFAGATVHDAFNFLAVLVLLPIEAIVQAAAGEGFLYYVSSQIVGTFSNSSQDLDQELLKVITKPLTSKIIKIDKGVIKKIATGEAKGNESLQKEGDYLFQYMNLADSAAGGLLLVISLIALCVCLVAIVRLLHSMVKGRIALWIRKIVNMKFPGKAAFLADYVAIVFGAAITILVQSSSIFTSTLTPLVGIGVITIERTYPLTLGSNIGTTCTGVLAALSSDKLSVTLTIAFCHLLFNVIGILIWFPIPFMRKIPIGLAKNLGMITANYRWFPLVYLFLVFFILPGIILALSLAGWRVLVGVLVPVVFFIIAVAVINKLQSRHPHVLPAGLRSWDWLPLWLRSLEPYDRVFSAICLCRTCRKSPKAHEAPPSEKQGNVNPISLTDL